MTKMEIYALRIIDDTKKTIQYQYDHFQSFGYFTRGSVRDLTHHTFDLIAERLQNLKEIGLHRMEISELPDCVLYIKRGLKLNYLLAGHSSLKHMTITGLFKTIGEQKTDKEITTLLDDFNAHPEAYKDKIDKINQQLDGIKEIMHKNIEGILNRGEKIDKLVEDSDKLSDTSKIFFKQAKRVNCRWCTIL